MAEQADVLVKNLLRSRGDVTVSRELPDLSRDISVMVAENNIESIPLPSPEVSLIIDAPGEMDSRECRIQVKSDIDLIISYSRSESFWRMKINPNNLPPSVPTTVNVNIGEDEPEPPEGDN